MLEADAADDAVSATEPSLPLFLQPLMPKLPAQSSAAQHVMVEVARNMTADLAGPL